MEKIQIDIGNYKIAKDQVVLEILSLGSCLGVILYDPVTKVGGVAHIMLPDSSLSKDAPMEQPAKFADTAIPLMIREMVKFGANKTRLIAKIVGGASMFEPGANESQLYIGERNIEAARQALIKAKIPIFAEDTGKNYGRTVEFDVSSGKVFVKSSLIGIKEL